MAFSDLQHLILEKEPPEKRRSKADGGIERHMSEAAAMLAFAMHLFSRGAQKVAVHPDGEHGKRFEIQAWLAAHGFTWQQGWGTTSYAGRYMNGGLILEVHVKPGRGDVVATIRGCQVVAECKGGIINTRHAGQISRLRKGLHEAAGQLLTRSREGEINVAVVPSTTTTRDLGNKMTLRANQAGDRNRARLGHRSRRILRRGSVQCLERGPAIEKPGESQRVRSAEAGLCPGRH